MYTDGVIRVLYKVKSEKVETDDNPFEVSNVPWAENQLARMVRELKSLHNRG